MKPLSRKKTSIHEDIFDDDPQQLQKFFNLEGLFSANHSAIPVGIRVISYVLTLLFSLSGLFIIISTIFSVLSSPFGFGPRSLMLVTAGVVSIFCGLKLTEGIVVFWNRKVSKAKHFSTFFSKEEFKNKQVSFYPVAPESVSAPVTETLKTHFQILSTIQNAIVYETEYIYIVMGEYFSSRRSTGSPTGVIASDKYVIYMKSDTQYEPVLLQSNETISKWFYEHLQFEISKVIPLDMVRVQISKGGIYLLLPNKLKSPEIAYKIVQILARNCYQSAYIDVSNNPESLLTSSLTARNILWGSIAIGDSLQDINALPVLDDAQLECIKNECPENGVFNVSKGCFITLKNYAVDAIHFTAEFWEGNKDISKERLQRELKSPDFTFDNYLAMDDYIDKEEYYQYFEQGLEVTLNLETGFISELCYKYFSQR